MGGTLICSHIRRLGLFFGFKSLNFNNYWVFRKMNIFLDMKILWIFFGGSSQNWASLRVISMHFMVFFKVKGTELGYFLGLLSTLENLCTRTAQSSRGVRSRRVHKIYYFGLL